MSSMIRTSALALSVCIIAHGVAVAEQAPTIHTRKSAVRETIQPEGEIGQDGPCAMQNSKDNTVTVGRTAVVTIRNGDRLTGEILNGNVRFKTPSAPLTCTYAEVERIDFDPEDVDAAKSHLKSGDRLRYTIEDDGIESQGTETVRLYLKSGECLTGTFQDDAIRIKPEYGSKIGIDTARIREIEMEYLKIEESTDWSIGTVAIGHLISVDRHYAFGRIPEELRDARCVRRHQREVGLGLDEEIELSREAVMYVA